MKSEIYPLNLPADLAKEVRQTAKDTGLSMAEAMRQGLKFGLPKLRERLRNGRITNIDPLPEKVARLLYQKAEDDREAIKVFMDAQAKTIEE
jgi:hypothetical protein